MLSTQAILAKQSVTGAGHALNMLANQAISPITPLPFGFVLYFQMTRYNDTVISQQFVSE